MREGSRVCPGYEVAATRDGPILLVERGDERRALFGGWLEAAGYEVLSCPGPSAPEYSCIGRRSGHCPLVEAASLVVLDLSCSSEPEIRPTIDVQLLAYYLMTGTSIVALGRGEDLLAERGPERVTSMERTPARQSFLAAVGSLLRG
jgi:hypothetical protein